MHLLSCLLLYADLLILAIFVDRAYSKELLLIWLLLLLLLVRLLVLWPVIMIHKVSHARFHQHDNRNSVRCFQATWVLTILTAMRQSPIRAHPNMICVDR